MSSIVNYFELQNLLERKRAQRQNTYALSITDKGNQEIHSFYNEIDNMEHVINDSIGVKNAAQAIEVLTNLRSFFTAQVRGNGMDGQT